MRICICLIRLFLTKGICVGTHTAEIVINQVFAVFFDRIYDCKMIYIHLHITYTYHTHIYTLYIVYYLEML